MKTAELKWQLDKGEMKSVFKMAWPAVLESFFASLAGMVDTLMVGAVGAHAVAAVGLTTQPKFIAMALFIAVNVAVASVVARRKGQQNREEANRTLMITALLTVAFGILVSIVCVAQADTIISLCGSNADTHEEAAAYFRIIMAGMLFNLVSMVINAAQRGAGNTRVAMYTNVTSNVVNMCANYLLIGGHFGFPALGVRGAAYATVLGTVIACFMSILSIFKVESFLSIPYIIAEKLKLSLVPMQSIIKIGGSIFTEQVLMRIGFLSTAVMAADMGTGAMAAHQVGMNILGLSFSFGDGMQAAAVALIGQSLGKKDRQLAKRYGNMCQLTGALIAVVLAVTFLFGGGPIFDLFFKEQEIVDIGIGISRTIALVILFQVPQVVFTGCLRGAGDVVFTMVSSTASVTVVRTAVSYIMCYVAGFGIIGVWMGIVADQLCRLAFNSARFKTGKWMKYEI